MKLFVKILRVTCFMIIGLFGFNSSSLAAVLPYGTIITDDQGITIKNDGKYLVDIENIMPGDTFRKEIIIRSEEKVEPYDLSLRVAKIESTGKINWNEHVLLTLTLDGKKVYQGKILGPDNKDWSKEDLILGEFTGGTERKLVATFDIDNKLTNTDYSEKSTLLYNWEFIATRKGVPVDDSKKQNSPNKNSLLRLPQTGEEWREFIYKAIAGMLLILLTFLIWQIRRKHNEDEH